MLKNEMNQEQPTATPAEIERDKEWAREFTRQQADIEACVRLHSRGYLTDKQMGPLAKRMLGKIDKHKACAPKHFLRPAAAETGPDNA